MMRNSDGKTGSPESSDAVRKAAAPYRPTFLAVYDVWVIRLSNRIGWRCPAGVMLDQYNRYAGNRHLEVGPGSGWYPMHTRFPGADGAEITLMDLNPSALAYAARRLRKAGHTVNEIVADVLEPVPAVARYDSIGINFVLHCVPGSFARKGVAFGHLSRALADDGVLFGSTIRGEHEMRSRFGRLLTHAYRRIGAFNNSDDNRQELASALDTAFAEYCLTDVGDVTLFRARRPKR